MSASHKNPYFFLQVAYPYCLQLIPVKTSQSFHPKFRAIDKSFETNLDCTVRHRSFVYHLVRGNN